MSTLVGASEWIRPKAWKMDWELRQGNEVVAKMSPPTFFGTTVRATLGDDAFVLRKGGLHKPGAAISRAGESNDVALLEIDALEHGTVVFADGTACSWQKREPAGTWALSKSDGTLLFTVYRDVRSKYPTGKVEVVTEDGRNGILLLLTWFMISTTDF
jgi:hypothetical protein